MTENAPKPGAGRDSAILWRRPGADDAATNRREHVRTELQASVSLSSETNFYSGHMNDVSEGGLFVATREPQAIGTVLVVEFSLPDDELTIFVKGEVRWIREEGPGPEGVAGMGIRFLNLHEDDRQRIEAFVQKRATIVHEDAPEDAPEGAPEDVGEES
ncbi:MAG: TIGR02266 family protein [Deltaproteobacteria bacterium]|nr:TIGR02266 family protein [Deltaproteobacteria bacterium]